MMKALVCSRCGNYHLVKQGEYYVCQYCGVRFSVNDEKKMVIDGKVDVSGSSIRLDSSDRLKNLYQIARRAKDDNDGKDACRYYDLIRREDPRSWEAYFYLAYFKAISYSITQMQSAGDYMSNRINTVFRLIKENVENEDEQNRAVFEVSLRCAHLSSMLFSGMTQPFTEMDAQMRGRYIHALLNHCVTARDMMYTLGNCIDRYFSNRERLCAVTADAWKNGIEKHKKLLPYLSDQDLNNGIIWKYIEKVRKYDENYMVVKQEEPKKKCYVATCVYGSYDCPQVWTLRRFRDETLANSWHGRAFIRVYYAISPTIVRVFGNSQAFRKHWRRRLDKLVFALRERGISDLPYRDRDW